MGVPDVYPVKESHPTAVKNASFVNYLQLFSTKEAFAGVGGFLCSQCHFYSCNLHQRCNLAVIFAQAQATLNCQTGAKEAQGETQKPYF